MKFNNNTIKIANTYVSITDYLLQKIKIHWCKKNIQYSMLYHFDFKPQFNWHLETINIAGIYVGKWCIYNPFIELIKVGINSQHAILSLHKKKRFMKNHFQVILPTFISASLVVLYFLGAWCIDDRYIWHYITYLKNI